MYLFLCLSVRLSIHLYLQAVGSVVAKSVVAKSVVAKSVRTVDFSC